MGFLDRLFGREEPRQNDSQPQGAGYPGAGYPPQSAGQPSPFSASAPTGGSQAPAGQGRSEDEIAVERYRYLLRTAPPETIEQVHEEAFAKLTPEQRRLVFQQLSETAPAGEQPRGDDPRSLAQSATRSELRQPGTMERVLGGGRGPGYGGGMGFGGMFASSLLGSVAGYVIGSALVSAFLPSPWDNQADGGAGNQNGDNQNDNQNGDNQNADSQNGGDQNGGDQGANDQGDGGQGGDAGSTDGGSTEAAGWDGGGDPSGGDAGGWGGDSGGVGGGDFGGGDFGGGGFGGGDFGGGDFI